MSSMNIFNSSFARNIGDHAECSRSLVFRWDLLLLEDQSGNLLHFCLMASIHSSDISLHRMFASGFVNFTIVSILFLENDN